MRTLALLAMALIVRLQGAASQTGGCESGWSRSPDKCFALFGIAIHGETRLTWSEADEACKAMGASLATVPNAETQPILTAILVRAPPANVWIGLNDMAEEGAFSWQDGTALSGFTNWGLDQPDNGVYDGFDENCVYLQVSDDYPGEWYDGYCDFPRAYICEKPQDPVLPTLSPSLGCYLPPDKNYVLYERACYKLDTTARPYNESRLACHEDTAEAIYIGNAYEEAFVEAFLLNAKETSAWIGLESRMGIDSLVWSAEPNRPIGYSKWAAGQPTSTADCAVLTSDGWRDQECTQAHPVLCKKFLARDPIPPTTLRGSACPEGMIPAEDDYCVMNSTQAASWEDAGTGCRALHATATLASMHSLSEKNTIGGFLLPDVATWIGLHTNYRDEFVWDDGSVVDYVNFNGSEISEECVQVVHQASSGPDDDTVWSTRNCSHILPYVCRAPKIFIPSETGGCTAGWFRLGNKCIFSVGLEDPERRDYADSQAFCREQGGGRGELYRVTDQIRQSMLALLLQGYWGRTNLWIGLSDSNEEGEFRWTDGTPLGGFTQWARNQPDGYTALPNEPYRDCVEVKADPNQLGKWDDINCLDRRGYICETYLDPTLSSNDTALPEMCTGSYADFTRYNDSCYKLVNASMNYADAKEACSDEGALVTRARDGYYNSLLTLILNLSFDSPPHVWLSLAQDSAGTYEWEPSNVGQDGWPTRYANWDESMPTGERCVVLQGDSTWASVPCEDEHFVICQHTDTSPEPADTSPVHCPDGWTLIERHCYRFDTLTPEQPKIHFTFTEAQMECSLRYNATLPGLHSNTANSEFRGKAESSLGKRHVWLGLHRSVDGYYFYDDSSVVDYVKWDSTGSGPGSECVGLDTESGRWTADHCGSVAGLVCETKPLPGEEDPCPPSWTKNQDACYYVSDSGDAEGGNSWHEAESWCNMNKGHLTTLRTGEERDFVQSLLYREQGSFWVGLNDIATQGEWIWADGTSYDLVTADWSPDDIRHEFNMQRCVVINEKNEWEDHNCGLRLPFVCKWDISQDTPIVVTRPPLIGGCTTGSFRLEDRCYDLTSLNEEMTWMEAHRDCQFRSGELASIHDPGVQALLSNALNVAQGSVWIGLSRYGIYDQYYWSDGSTTDFTNWALGEPNSPYQQQGHPDKVDYCVELVNNPTYAGTWSDSECEKKNGFVCQKSLDTTEKEDPLPIPLCPDRTDYLGYREGCYKIVTFAATNPNAEAECEAEGAVLASLGDAYEEAFVAMLLDYYQVESAWIGLRRGSYDQFEWLDGWPTVYTHWLAGYPTGSNNLNRCVVITPEGWRNLDCYGTQHAVCKTTTADKPQPPQPPTGSCPRNWHKHQDRCYYFDKERPGVSYLEAHAFCQALGPEVYPASCQDGTANTFLQNTAHSVLGVSRLWLGLFYQNDEFKWTDGSPYVYSNWKSDLPQMPVGSHACVQLDTAGAGQWENTDCFIKAGYACVAPLNMLPTTAMPPTEPAVEPPEPQTGLSFEATIGLGVGVGVVAAIVILSVFCFQREKKREKYKRSIRDQNDDPAI